MMSRDQWFTLCERVSDAEARASFWLAEANRRLEAGRDDSRELSKAQFWLDKANRLKGDS